RPVYVTALVLIALVAGWLVLRGQLGGSTPSTLPAGHTGVDQVDQFDPAKPYANTPAAAWADGADGIVLPAPAAVGAFSARQVGTAETQVKQILVAEHLDNRMLVQHDAGNLLPLLAPNMQTHLRGKLSNPANHDDSGVVSQLMPGFQLLPVPIKVDGSMSAQVSDKGELVVHTNYVFAFPFVPSDPSSIQASWQVVAVQHVQEEFDVVSGANYVPADHGIWLGATQSYDSSIDCAASNQGYLAPAYANPPDFGGAGADDPNADYDPSHAMTIPDTCKS
ncbi:MAG TPA: hypothetical protein VHZ97_26060, partial [Pseudonocardiaceae bacterium]|nr:hypothetical protein [Pseudonocardiaceae bacterium]